MAVTVSTQVTDCAATQERDLVAELQGGLAQGTLVLPSYPDVAIRIRKVLADDHATVERVGRVVSAEPALSAQLMRLANSAALNPGGRAVTEPKSAVARLGFNMVRSATIAFAMAQVKGAAHLRGLESELDALWHRSTLTAALCYVTARNVRGINADEALLAGLLHNIGALYLLSKAHQYRAVFADVEANRRIVEAWHIQLAVGLLKQWGMPSSIIQAVESQESGHRARDGSADLADVLIVARLLAASVASPNEVQDELQRVPALGRIGLEAATLLTILEQSQEQVKTLQLALAS